MLRERVVWVVPSATCTLKLEVPAEVGAPLIVPDELSDKPVGKDPEMTDHT
jgi:hypothetical protein